MKLPLFTLFFCLLIVGFVACNKDEPELVPIKNEYPEAPEINLQLQFKQAESIDSIGIQKFYENNNRLFALTYDKGILISDDSGLTWKESNNGIERSSYNYGPFVHIRLKSIGGHNNSVYLLGGDLLYYSSNNGENWINTNFYEQTQAPFPNQLGVFDDSTLCVSAGSGRLQYFRSTNFGQSWIHSSPEDPSFRTDYKYIDNEAYCIASWNSDGLIKSIDKGESWKSIGRRHDRIRDYAVKDDFILSSTNNGLFVLGDNNEWLKTNEEGFGYLEPNQVWQLLLVKDWIIASAGTNNLYISKIIDGKVSDWQKLEILDLKPLEEYGIVIDYIYYCNNRLIIGTSDYFNRFEWEGTHGRGIWYAEFPLD